MMRIGRRVENMPMVVMESNAGSLYSLGDGSQEGTYDHNVHSQAGGIQRKTDSLKKNTSQGINP
jgi:hypothetical protein